MPRPRLSPMTVAVVMLLGAAGGAFASSATERANEISTVLTAKTSIAQAIAAAEAQTGGYAVKAEVERKDSKQVYEVKTVTEEERSKVFVDPASGKVVEVRKEGFLAKLFDSDDLITYERLRDSPVKLAAAIATAEHETGGKAIEGEFKRNDSKGRFEVETARDKEVRKVRVDGTTGKIVETPHGS